MLLHSMVICSYSLYHCDPYPSGHYHLHCAFLCYWVSNIALKYMSLLQKFCFLMLRSHFSSSAAAMGATVNMSKRLVELRELMGKKENNVCILLSKDQRE